MRMATQKHVAPHVITVWTHTPCLWYIYHDITLGEGFRCDFRRHAKHPSPEGAYCSNNPFTFDYSINDKQKTPYAQTFNLALEHQTDIICSRAYYVGRLGRHLVQNLDVTMPINFYDVGSGQSYFKDFLLDYLTRTETRTMS